MVCFPGCKINIGLFVTKKRDDGYHDLETVFYPIPLKDALEAIPAKEKATITLQGKSIAGDTQSNLVWKAYQLLRQDFPEKVAELEIHLLKNIPMGAGLGGGSSDGAFMLRLINDLCQLNLSNETLARYALQLGSDCPFFIYNTPQFARGRGEVMQPVDIDLSAYSLQLICPDVHVSTAEAFRNISPAAAATDLRKLASIPVSDWKDSVRNDFEKTVFAVHPALAEIKEQLYAQGAIYASMSGSGAALYGIFDKGKKAVIHTELAFEDHYIQ